jgi:hypothetical protein
MRVMMDTTTWKEICKIKLDKQDVIWPWSLAVDAIRDVTHLCIRASGAWVAYGGQLMPFPPDGHVGLPIDPTRLILPECAAGALIGKMGGSSAAVTPAATGTVTLEARPFAVGAYCVLAIPAQSKGPLFIGFNWIPRPLTITSLEVTVSGAAFSS